MEIKSLDKETAARYIPQLAATYLNKETSDVTYAGGGSFGLAYFVHFAGGGKAVFKAFRIDGMHRTQALETETLAAHCTLPMPKTLFLHDADDQIPMDVIGMECMEGIPAVNVNPYLRSPKKRHAMADTLTQALNTIHQAHNDKFGLLENAVYDGWLDYYKPYAEEICEWTVKNGREHNMSQEMVDIVSESWERFDEIFAEPITQATLIHADLNVCNIMIDKKTLQPTGIIDPWRTMWADRDYDLHQLYNMTGDGYYLYETYKKKYPVSRTCDLKCAFYALYNEIYCYMVSHISFEAIYPRQIKNLRKQMDRFLSKE